MSENSLRRGNGDGMDSEDLADPSKVPLVSLGRHQNLQISHHATTVIKLASPKPVPHEPVKAAVRHITKERSNKRGAKQKKIKVFNQPEYCDVKYGKHYSSLSTDLGQLESKPEGNPTAEALSPNEFPLPYSNNPVAKPVCTKDGTKVLPTCTSNFVSHKLTCLAASMDGISASTKGEDGMEMRAQVEGCAVISQYQLEEQLQKLKQQLEFQTQVNVDLKKLLVASVGDDLQCRVESLAKDKVALGQQLGSFCDRLTRHNENLDTVSIQADLWRTKFIASRLQVEGLQRAHNEMADKWSASFQALQSLFGETQHVYSSLTNIQRYVSDVVLMIQPSADVKTSYNTVTDVTNNTERLSQILRTRLVGKILPSPQVPLLLTPAQSHAKQVLLSMPVEPRPCLIPRSNSRQFMRWHPAVLCDNITFTCCPRCKGEIYVI